MNKSQFIKICRDTLKERPYELSRKILDITRSYSIKNKHKLPVIWLETDDSGDNNISFMNTTYPYLDRVFTDLIDLYYSNTFMAAQGDKALDILKKTVINLYGKYTLVVEGAIPVNTGGLYNIVFIDRGIEVTALKAVKWLAAGAEYIVSIGTCSSFGGPTSAKPNITGSVPVSKLIDKEVIKVSGCPVNPDWFVGTLAHLLLYGIPELDKYGRPALFYGKTVHRNCQRRSYFDDKDFADELGEQECMFSQGCVGPRTGSDCPYRLWVNHVSYPIKVNTPCIGCTNPDFPDGSSPFFVPLPDKKDIPDTEVVKE